MAFSSVTIIGAGPAGCGIAIACAAERFPVTLVRGGRSSVDAMRARIQRRLRLCVEVGDFRPEDELSIASRIEIASSASRVDEADLVIDASICDARARRATLATLESRLSSGAVLATAAPSDQLAGIAEALRRPDQFVGLRFVLPAMRSPRVELAFLPETAPGAMAACRAFVGILRKTSVELKSEPPRIGYREWLSAPLVAAE